MNVGGQMERMVKITKVHIGIIGLVCLGLTRANYAQNAGGPEKPNVPVQFVQIDSGIFNMALQGLPWVAV